MKILIIEDNSDDIVLTLRAFRKDGLYKNVEILVARDGSEGLGYLFGDAVRMPLLSELTLIVLDLKLPKVDGLTILQRLQDKHGDEKPPVVVLSSSNEHSDILASYRYGANSFLQKPVDAVEFSKVVRHLGKYWLLLNTVSPRVGMGRKNE